MAVQVKVKKTGRMKGPNLSDPQLKRIGEVMVKAQLERWSKGINAYGNPARKLSVKYAIAKGSYLRKHGIGGRPIRDMKMTGLTVKNFSLRKAADNTIRAENTSREARAHASRANKLEEMIGFAGSDQIAVFQATQQEYGKYLQKAWVTIG